LPSKQAADYRFLLKGVTIVERHPAAARETRQAPEQANSHARECQKNVSVNEVPQIHGRQSGVNKQPVIDLIEEVIREFSISIAKHVLA
jgi:hypothetical protein